MRKEIRSGNLFLSGIEEVLFIALYIIRRIYSVIIDEN